MPRYFERGSGRPEAWARKGHSWGISDSWLKANGDVLVPKVLSYWP